MNTDNLNKWLTLVANVGVIAGIAFLAMEIRQSNQIAVATNEIAIRDSYGSSNELVAANPEIARILSKARDRDAEFTGPETEMAEYFISRMLNIYTASEMAYRLGMASRATLDVALDDLRWTYDAYPGLQYAFHDSVAIYGSSGRTEVYQTVVELQGSQ